MAEIIHLAAYRLARNTGWTPDMALGYLRGNAYRLTQIPPPPEQLDASDDYGVGVQLGYRYGLQYLRWLKEAQSR